MDITVVVSNGGTATVTGGSAATIPAGQTGDFSYVVTYASTPSPLTGTNTATVSLHETPSIKVEATTEFDFGGSNNLQGRS